MKRVYTLVCCLSLALLCVGFAQAQSGTPSPEHKVLKADEGTWVAHCTMYMPGAPEPMEFEGTEVNRMLGEMWLISDFKADFGGMPFEGHATLGFDPKQGKFIGTWIDSFNPYTFHMTGVYDEATKTMAMDSKGVDPTTGEESEGKTEVVYGGDDSRTMTMWKKDGDEYVKEMVIVYKRKK